MHAKRPVTHLPMSATSLAVRRPLSRAAAPRIIATGRPDVTDDSQRAAAPPLPDVVARARAGDDAAFHELYVQYRRRVAAQLSHLVAPGDVEDALQESFVEVFRSISRFEGRSSFDTWLYRIVLRVATRSRKKLARALGEARFDEPPERADPSDGPLENALTSERGSRTEALLGQLSPKKRTVLVLHDLRGMEAAQIALLLGSNILTVRTRLFYARREFEKLASEDPSLSDYFPTETSSR